MPFRFTQLLVFPSIVVGVILRATVCWGATITFDFAQSNFGWVPGFADYPSDADPVFYELESDYRPRPANLGSAGSIFIHGHNHSDDLFMFLKKPLDGLAPNTLYKLIFYVELASKYPTGLGGIGGSPGDSVYLKAGGSTIEPDAVIQDDDYGRYYRMNIDKGNQSEGGQDAIVLGTIAKPEDGTFDYALIERDNLANPLHAWTSGSGRLWLLVGTDSGFEGATGLYYTKIIVEFEPVLNPLRLSLQGQTVTLEWDVGILQTSATLSGQWTDLPNATSPRQENVSAIPQKFWRLRARQP
jgi:hypothetical protein